MARADLTAVAAVEVAAHLHPRPIQAFGDELDQPHAHLWVLEQPPGLWGLLDFWCVAGEIELLDVAVHPARQGRGLGRRLMGHLFAEAARLGTSRIHLEVRPSNGAARALYGGLGFQRVGRRRRYYSDGEDALLLSTSLAQLG